MKQNRVDARRKGQLQHCPRVLPFIIIVASLKESRILLQLLTNPNSAGGGGGGGGGGALKRKFGERCAPKAFNP